MKLSGRYAFTLRSLTGEVIDRRETPNLVVNVGLAQVASLIGGLSTGTFGYIALGQGMTSPASSDTTLESEITSTSGGGSRTAATISRVTTDVTNDTVKFFKTFTFTSGTTGGYAITEAAIFNSSGSSGVMLSRATFTAINVVSSNTLDLDYRIDCDST